MAEEGVIGATVEEAERHPWILAAGLTAVIVLLYVLSSGKSPAGGQPFTFSYGPSDAQVKAGTAQQIALQADQTAVTLANIQATTGQAVSQSYFGYLTNNSANQTAATITASNNALALGTTQSNNAVIGDQINGTTQQIISANQTSATIAAAQYATQAALSGNATQAQIAQIQSDTAKYQTSQNDQTALAINKNNNLTAVTTAGYAASTSQILAADQLAGTQSTNAVNLAAANLNAQVQLTQIGSTERLTANQQQANQAVQLQQIQDNYALTANQNQVYAAALLAQNRGPWA